MRTGLLLTAIGSVCWANSMFETWKMDAARSTFTGAIQPKSLTVRIEPHAKGEVFTLDRIEADGRTTSSSTILYFDGAPRDFQDFECSGTQSSRRMDSQTVEILRRCASGDWIWFVRRSAEQPKELILDIKENRRGGRRFEWRMVLEKQEVKQPQEKR